MKQNDATEIHRTVHSLSNNEDKEVVKNVVITNSYAISFVRGSSDSAMINRKNSFQFNKININVIPNPVFARLFLTQLASRLKALDTFGYCQRPAFSFGVSQHIHKITSL